MKSFKYKYPGDPSCEVQIMNRQEFLEACPRKPIKIYTSDSVHEIPMGPDEILCDSCSRDPGDVIYLDRTRAYCQECAEQWLLPHKI